MRVQKIADYKKKISILVIHQVKLSHIYNTSSLYDDHQKQEGHSFISDKTGMSQSDSVTCDVFFTYKMLLLRNTYINLSRKEE